MSENNINYSEEALKMHMNKKGKIEVVSKVKVESKDDLSIAYTPGVAQPCIEINKNVEDVYKYTSKGNLVAVVSDGSAVLGLGNIGAEASIPVMEGKAILFKEFAGVDSFPICLKTQDVDEIVNAVKLIEPVFGGINLEDISAPRCFEIERRLKKELDIPVFHDDQHGTAIIVTAGILNSIRLLGDKKIEELEIVINGAGAAGIAICKMLLDMNVKNIVLCDKYGILEENSRDINWAQKEMLKYTNKNKESGTLADAVKGKDVFIGVSRPKMLTSEMIKTMAKDPIVFAMANPIPEIMPGEAKESGVFVLGTGRSDFPNQVNNVLAFPGVFKGALECRASEINEAMKVAAAKAIADFIPDEKLSREYILPNAFETGVADAVAEAVKRAAVDTKVNKIEV
ncbi:NAD(P)-dependent malic enzyme [Peptostreptococcus porci]|uniref:NAD(P)-dependent malic enzyme n=1 Tax=Peptostreptococcus porci TaxID=2652282 RepID=UPI0012B23EF0|nr:malic enzyme-like NAD(P)-binding protein [Peptostreptococcus porci]MDY2795195.1 malic enzyme-like NAD(P)-binding protein [Peptostreptococcus porci]MDY4127804.1 malic enzyme-like NAD(P)-binding protein [Peptostreptococcus porci]MDY6231042.1 malic enzyme-like NAD(P)-binding protein [Peptostreptococcus porci]